MTSILPFCASVPFHLLVHHDPDNHGLFAPLQSLCNDFQAFCAQQGVSVPWALYHQQCRSTKFRKLIKELVPQATITHTTRKIRGQNMVALFWFGVQLAGDSVDGCKVSKGAQYCAEEGEKSVSVRMDGTSEGRIETGQRDRVGTRLCESNPNENRMI